MLKMENIHISFNGASVIDEVTIAHFNAHYSGQEVNCNMVITDLDNYNANASVVEADFDDFKDKALKSINSMV
jgi:hypothetical protein